MQCYIKVIQRAQQQQNALFNFSHSKTTGTKFDIAIKQDKVKSRAIIYINFKGLPLQSA